MTTSEKIIVSEKIKAHYLGAKLAQIVGILGGILLFFVLNSVGTIIELSIEGMSLFESLAKPFEFSMARVLMVSIFFLVCYVSVFIVNFRQQRSALKKMKEQEHLDLDTVLKNLDI